MLLIDSLYIHRTGTKVLLNYLVSELETKNIEPYYLFDLRCSDDFKSIPDERKKFLHASLWNRHRFYKENMNRFTSIFCLGNIPPSLKLKDRKVITYFHQYFFLRKVYPSELKEKIMFLFKKIILTFFYKNTDIVVVQSDFIKNEFIKTYGFQFNRVLEIPFFDIPPLPKMNSKKRENSFVYVSEGYIHKNHLRLLKAWELLSDENYYPELGLTIDVNLYPKINNEIKRLQQKGLNIINYGFTDPYKLYKEYEYLIYPSTLETLGLSQVEAINCGCKVIASNLPHTFAIVQPSAVFDPLSVDSIKKTVLDVLQSNGLQESKIIIKNKITELIELIR